MKAFAAVDPAGVALFRLAFGLILAWELIDAVHSGSVHSLYVAPSFRFTYHGFAWVEAPPFGVAGLFYATAGAAAALALGLWQRVSAALFFLGFGWIFVLEKARYLNHFYLILLLGLLLACVRADGAYSIVPRSRRKLTPAWGLALLRAQVGLVYLHAGIAKLNADWLRAAPLRDWLSSRADHPVLGPVLDLAVTPWVFSYGAIALDLLAWPALAWKSTRRPAFAVVTAFHLTNHTLFSIGVFPWTMIAASTLFFEPDWPRRFLGGKRPDARAAEPPRRLVLVPVALYLVFQVLYPLRHFLYAGRPSWNEEGHRFAWHMKLRDKEGEVRFHVRDTATQEAWVVDPRTELTARQYRKINGSPDMMIEYAHHLARRYRASGHASVEVRASAKVSLNGRKPQVFVDPDVDLAGVERGFAAYDWILPLKEKLPGYE